MIKDLRNNEIQGKRQRKIRKDLGNKENKKNEIFRK